MMVEERRTRRQRWFVCTIACNILLEVRKLILSNKTNNENEVTLKEFMLYVLYYAAVTLGGVDTYADGRNPPHMNLLDPKHEAIIIEGMEEIHGKFHSGGWFDPVAIQIVPNAHINWIDGKAERAAIEKIVSDIREEDWLWELERARIITDTSLHTLVETWDPKTRDWVPNNYVSY
ncbi:hypothetical protein M422DRAFT_267499 [Sphaerobolus stellatus SS14]|uniref:Uncharacterized protein n=1 Tax=Sphaerobolus stellatus (strain SS14) TaxID=990650 RepID=A0A0C9UPM0_SPHS4|nr:hypothetical protein M422DRAFT_267499 [Sphaerobolus stellatus SS14]